MSPSPRPSTPLSATWAKLAFKQILWILGISSEEMTPGAGLIAGLFYTLLNAVNTLLALWTVTSAALLMDTQWASIMDVVTSSLWLMFGLGLNSAGMVVEFGSEVVGRGSRTRLGRRGSCRGVDCGLGLRMSIMVGICFGGVGMRLMLWGRCGGLLQGLLDFSRRAIPLMDGHCSKVCLSIVPVDRQVANGSGAVWGTGSEY